MRTLPGYPQPAGGSVQAPITVEAGSLCEVVLPLLGPPARAAHGECRAAGHSGTCDTVVGRYGADTGVPPAPHAERPCRTQCERFILDIFALRSQRSGGPCYSAYVITQPRCLLASSAHSITGRLECFPGAHAALQRLFCRGAGRWSSFCWLFACACRQAQPVTVRS